MPNLPPKWRSSLENLSQILIIWSMISLALETEPSLTKFKPFFDASELFVVAFFTGEYLVRLVWAENKWKYIISPAGIIDLLAILPSLISFGSTDLRTLRACRLLRLFRIGKLYRYNKALHSLVDAFKDVKDQLAVTLIVGIIMLYVSAMIMYHMEHAAQPEAFSSISKCLWWAIVSYTTVGYGDAAPITGMGRFFAGASFLIANGIIGLPPVIIGSAVVSRHINAKDGAKADVKAVYCSSSCLESTQNDVR